VLLDERRGIGREVQIGKSAFSQERVSWRISDVAL
jgi:hypothetical protein